MNGVNPKGVREEYADRLGAPTASAAEAAVAGAAVAPVLTHKDNKKWPKWRDMRHVLQHDDSGASIDTSVAVFLILPGSRREVVLTLKNLLSSI